MTKKPSKRTASVARSAIARKATTIAKKPVKPHPLDPLIATGAKSLGLKVERAWLPAVRTHLQVTLVHGERVAAFALPDDTEPAPVFEA
jgi:hypothetical protein